MSRARIEKRDHNGVYVWHYDGQIVKQDPQHIVVEARMTRDAATDYLNFRRGDRMVETFYTYRGYNVMEVHDVDDDRLKGWYCNITRYPTIVQGADSVTVAYEDLALDAFISPVGDLLVLDEDEMAALKLPTGDVAHAWYALGMLRGHVESREFPFDKIKG